MCPNCALNLAAIGPGYWAAFFILGVFTLLGGYLYFVYGWGTGEDHVAVKRSILECEDDDLTEEAPHG
ncbi:MAG TPA: hypothetical protein VEI97_03365 [bacterium]|nr:hypothetical protein [bacterium]